MGGRSLALAAMLCTIAACAGSVIAQQPQPAEQQHLAFGAPGSMTVSWVTLFVQPAQPVARYMTAAKFEEALLQQQQQLALQPQPQQQHRSGRHGRRHRRPHRRLSRDAAAEAEAVENVMRRLAEEEGAWVQVAAETKQIGDGNCSHNAIMTNLAAGERYVYIVGDLGTGLFTAPESFLYDMVPGADTPFTIGIVGDMGIAPYGNGTAARLAQHAEEFNWVMHVGDLAYADDRKDSKDPVQYNEYFNTFGREITPTAKGRAYMVCPGNHEVFCHSEGELVGRCPKPLLNFTSFNARYRMPGKDSGSSNDNMWYSFDYGKAHFIAINTETDYPHAPESTWEFEHAGGFGDQLGWLKADLAKAEANRDNVPWIIVYGHRPMYTTQKQGWDRVIWNNATGILRAFIEDLMYNAHVDLYISGHVHAYERMLPMYRSKITDQTYNNPRGITSVIVGHAGNIEGNACSWEKQPAWEPVRTCAGFGYSRMTVNATHLDWQMFFTKDDSLQDHFVITKF